VAALRVVLDTNVLLSGIAYPGSIPGRILAARQSGGADYLVTGDKDLLALAPRHPTREPGQFWSAHGGL
jgi:predicted nucleic acid-binding protein